MQNFSHVEQPNLEVLEKGYALYGHELSEEILPNETIASWAVKLKKEHFLGKKAIIDLKYPRKQYGVGFRANLKGDILNLQIGFSHDVSYKIPEGIKVLLKLYQI